MLTQKLTYQSPHTNLYISALLFVDWSALDYSPPINFSLSSSTIKNQIKCFMWAYFSQNFDSYSHAHFIWYIYVLVTSVPNHIILPTSINTFHFSFFTFPFFSYPWVPVELTGILSALYNFPIVPTCQHYHFGPCCM